MDHDEVRRVAEHEWSHWHPGDTPEHTEQPVGIDERRQAPGAYVSLDRAEPTTRFGHLAPLDVSVIGTVLILRFRWKSDPHQREYLLPVELSDHEPGDLDGASTTVLEAIAQLTYEYDWYEYKIAALSPRVAIVLPDYIAT